MGSACPTSGCVLMEEAQEIIRLHWGLGAGMLMEVCLSGTLSPQLLACLHSDPLHHVIIDASGPLKGRGPLIMPLPVGRHVVGAC